jgi:hypothetical protein
LFLLEFLLNCIIGYWSSSSFFSNIDFLILISSLLLDSHPSESLSLTSSSQLNNCYANRSNCSFDYFNLVYFSWIDSYNLSKPSSIYCVISYSLKSVLEFVNSGRNTYDKRLWAHFSQISKYLESKICAKHLRNFRFLKTCGNIDKGILWSI